MKPNMKFFVRGVISFALLALGHAATTTTTCDATKSMFVNRACCGGSSNESAICTAPSVDFSPLPHIKNDVQDVKHALEQIMEYEETSSKQEEKFEQELQNITKAQALAELRNERAITELLKLELREAQQLAATNEIKNTTKLIVNDTAKIKDEVSKSLHFSSVSHSELLNEETLDTFRYFEKPTIINGTRHSTQRLKIIGTEVFAANLTIKVALWGLDGNPEYAYVHADSSVSNTPHKESQALVIGNKRRASFVFRFSTLKVNLPSRRRHRSEWDAYFYNY